MTAPRGTDAEKRTDAERRIGPDQQPDRPQPADRSGPHESAPTTVLPGGRPAAAGPRPGPREGRPAPGGRPVVGRSRRARLSLKRIDPWSVFLFSLVASVFVGIAVIVAVAVLYAVVGALGITESVNELFAEVTGGSVVTDPLLTTGRVLGGATVLAAVNVVFLTLLATLSALLYNLCASFTGGLELTLGERD